MKRIKIWILFTILFSTNYNELNAQNTYTKEPYIINPISASNSVSVTIMWQIPDNLFSNTPQKCKVEYNKSGQSIQVISNITEITNDNLFKVTLSGLTPNTKYYYKVSIENIAVGSTQPFTTTYTFLTPPIGGNSIKFYAYGDTRGGKDTNGNIFSPPYHNSVCGQILNEIIADPVSQTLLLHGGDWINTDEEENWDEEYFNNLDNNAIELRSKVAIMGVKGNHEENGSHGVIYNKYFPFPYLSQSTTGNDWSFSFDYGPVHFLALEIDDESHVLSTAEISWINSDLTATNKEWKVILFHVPIKDLYGLVANSSTVAAIKQIAKQNNVQLVLMGHEHIYGHWVEDGTHYMTLGGGGAFIHSVNSSNLMSEDELYAATVAHFAKFDIQDDVMMVDVIQGGGSQIGRHIEEFSIPITNNINSSVLFNNPVDHPIVSDGITVANNGILTVNSSINMVKNSKITIEKGGKLIVDGANAVISNTHRVSEMLLQHDDNVSSVDFNASYTEDDNLWNGILVQGDDNYDQSDESKQGVLVMKNGATIENAKVGVYVGEYFVPNHLSSVDNNLSNGIIKISNSNFLNNQRDIVVRPNALNLIGSGSTSFRKNSIINTKFTNDGNMLTDPILNKGKIGNIRLNGVKWINLSGNTFENKDNTLAVANSGIGIDAINSGFTVEAGGTTTPSNHTLPNKFINLYQGIRVVNGINTSETVKINYNKFTNTYRAIFLSGTYDAEVLKNDIKASNMAYYQSGEPDPGVPYGIYINGGKGFKVEENKIWRAFSSSPAPVFNGSRGILVNNLGGVNNEIYKNITENLFISNQAQAYNSGSGVNAALGLKYLCNKSQTSANSYDFQTFGNWYVTYNGNFSWSLHQSGIAEFQQQKAFDPIDNQYVDAPAGNQFSSDHLTNETTVFDFDNGGGARIRYGWGDLTNTGEKWKPTEIDGVNVIPKPISQEIDVCPSKINSGGNGDNPTDMYAKLSDAYIAYNSSRILLDIWRDGGNTNLDEEVETTQPWDVYVEFNSLLAKSPYLSEDVLLEVVDNPAFTSLMIKLLMIANPHAKDNPRLMEAIKKRIPVMPKAYINDIRNKPDVTSQLKLLEGNVAADYHLITNIGENIKRMYRNDYTNAWVKDSLINFVGRQADLYDKYELATIYLSYGQYDEMNGTIENIYSSFKMNDEMTSELNTFKNTLDIAKLMQEKNLYENSLKKADVSALKSIVKEEKPIITPLALSLLKRNNPNYEYNEPIFNVERRSTRKTNIQTIANTETYNSTEYKLYPNPTNNYTTLSYNCRYSDMTYSIIDNTGRELIVNQLPTIEDVSSNEVLIDLSKLSNGVYQILIKTRGSLIWTEKLIVSE